MGRDSSLSPRRRRDRSPRSRVRSRSPSPSRHHRHSSRSRRETKKKMKHEKRHRRRKSSSSSTISATAATTTAATTKVASTSSRHHRSSTHYSRRKDSSRSPRRRHRSHSPHKCHKKGDLNENNTDVMLKVGRLNSDDYFSKNTEFILWLKECKGKRFSDLTSEKTHGYFKKFITAWNSGALDRHYYDGVDSREVSSSRTSFKWGFTKDKSTQSTVASVRDDVTAATCSGGFSESSKRTVKGPTLPPSIDGKSMADMQLRREDEQHELRSSRFAWNKRQKDDLEELLPKPAAGSREAKLEQKRYRAEQRRGREMDRSPEYSERSLMGGEGFHESVRRLNSRDSRREIQREAKRAETAVNLEAYKVKESATMAMFREMAKNHQLG